MLPTKKISLALIEFAEPLISNLPEGHSKEELESILHMAVGIWNACVLDGWANSKTQWVAEIRRKISESPNPMPIVITEHLIHRKQTLFADDIRGITNEHVFVRDGEFIVRAEARLDVENMTVTSLVN